MPRENSFSDSEGRSLTPDLDEVDEDSFIPEPVVPPSTRPARPSWSSSHKNTHLSPRDRFRAAVRKVIHLHRTSTILSRYGRVGAEPGVDPRRLSAFLHYGHIRENCIITLVDYSAVRSSSGKMTNREFVSLLEDARAGSREPWVKVRWINVCGVSWDVISALTLKYDLHPLAVEDIIHQRPQSRSKADYYPKHLFIRVLSHTLHDPDSPDTHEAPGDLMSELDVEDEASQELRESIRRESSPVPMDPDEKNKNASDEDPTVFGSRSATWRCKRRRSLQDVEGTHKHSKGGILSPLRIATRKESASRKRREKAQLTLEELKKEGRVHVNVQPISIFLLRNGTVISILPRNCSDFAEPILARLRQPETTLRTSADASLLVQGLLDLIVDSAFEVVDAFHEKILQLEHDVLLKPSMKTVARLHILSGDLTLHKRTMEPLKTMVYGLRRYDIDRSAALFESGERDVKVQGFMSHKAKIYLADVHDHVDYILTSMDSFASIAENLINYTFNIKSYEMNETMRRLTMATIIFLPLTLLTGYFGMNFEAMWSVNLHSDFLFWQIAIPVMAVVIPLFTWPDIKRVLHYMLKRFKERKRVKTKTL